MTMMTICRFKQTTINTYTQMKTHRKKVYDELKKYGLTNKANELFGHNFTQVSSNKLEKLIKEYKANLQAENKTWEAVDASQSCDEHGCHFDTHTAEMAAAKAVKNIEAYENKAADKAAIEAVNKEHLLKDDKPEWFESMFKKMKDKGLINDWQVLKKEFVKPETRRRDIEEILDRLDTIICLLRNMR